MKTPVKLILIPLFELEFYDHLDAMIDKIDIFCSQTYIQFLAHKYKYEL